MLTNKHLEKVVSLSKNSKTQKDVIHDIAMLTFNQVMALHPFSAPNCWKAEADDRIHQGLFHYEGDAEAYDYLQEITLIYLQDVAEGKPFEDHLGRLYAGMKFSKAKGQFMTPPDLASKLARFCFQFDKPAPGETVLMSDFTCGGGALALAMLAEYHKQQPEHIGQLAMMINDIDINMVRLTAAQIAISCLVHKIPLAKLTAHCSHAITEYHKPGTKVFVMSANSYIATDNLLLTTLNSLI